MKIEVGDRVCLYNGHEDVIVKSEKHIHASYMFGNLHSTVLISRDGFKFTPSGTCVFDPMVHRYGTVYPKKGDTWILGGANVKEIIKDEIPKKNLGLPLDHKMMSEVIKKIAESIHEDAFGIPPPKKKVKKYRWVYKNILTESMGITVDHLSEDEINKFYWRYPIKILEKINSTLKEVEIDS